MQENSLGCWRGDVAVVWSPPLSYSDSEMILDGQGQDLAMPSNRTSPQPLEVPSAFLSGYVRCFGRNPFEECHDRINVSLGL